MGERGKINVFYSYAHGDEEYRDQLVDHLGDLRDEGVISEWHDRMIQPGADWAREIEDNLADAHIVLFLVSPAFMRSRYCMGVEVEQAVRRHWANRCRIVPIILEAAPEWTETAFGSFQALPRDAKPVATWRRPETALANVAEGIRKVCAEIVDWENPLRRSAVGDWVETEMTTTAQGQRTIVRTRSVVVERDEELVVLRCTATIPGQPRMQLDVRFDLDAPADDSFGRLMEQIGETIPDNSQYYREETGRGEQKLMVGGEPFYCQWVGSRATWKDSESGVVAENRVWRCIDVPVDGVVKEERVVRGDNGVTVFETSLILVGSGHG